MSTACNTGAIKTLRDEHGFTTEELKIVREYFNEAEDLRVGDQNDYDVQAYLADQLDIEVEQAEQGLTADAINELGSNVLVRFPSSSKSAVVKKVTEKNGEFTLVTDRGTYYFAQGQDRSKNLKNKKIGVEVLGMGAFTNKVLNGRVYGNDMDAASRGVDWTKYDRIGEKINKDPAKMKELLNELYEMGGRQESETHIDFLRGLLDTMDPKFFKDLDVFVKESDEATAGFITKELTRVGINVSTNESILRNQMGPAEIYAHEMIHAITVFAIESAEDGRHREARKLVRELEHVMEIAKKEISSAEKLAPENATKEEMDIAKEQYDYIFNSEHAKAEFVAHAMTNPKIMEKLEKLQMKPQLESATVLEKIAEFFRTVTEILLGEYERKDLKKTALEQVVNLASRMANINAEHLNNAKESRSMMEFVNDSIDAGETFITDALGSVVDKFKAADQTLKPLPEGATKVDKVLWMVKYFHKVMFNEVYRNYFGTMMSSTGLSIFKPEGTIRDWLRAFTEASPMQKAVEWLGTAADSIDRMRTTIVGETKRVVLEGFHRKLSELEEEQLKEVLLDSDLQSLLDLPTYTQGKIRKILADPAELKKALSRAKHKLKMIDKETYNWNVGQANSLGYFMATGIGELDQNLNSVNIARGLQSEAKRRPTKKMIQAVDEVATLTALSYTSDAKKMAVAEIMLEESKYAENSGAVRLLNLHKHFVADSKTSVFTNSTTHMIKGYSKEIFDDRITMEVAPLNKQKEMESKGFKKVKTLEKIQGDSSIDMALYVSNAFMVSEHLRVATRLTALNRKGTSIEDIKRAEGRNFTKERIALDKAKIDLERIKIMKQRQNGTYDVTKSSMNMIPVLNEQGDVISYRYIMNKASKKEFLKQNSKVSDVMAKSFGSVFDKQQSQEHNKNVLKTILAYMKDDWVEGTTQGKDGTEFVLIGPNAVEKDIIELYKVLPKEFQQAINNREDKVIAVPRKLMHMYFGYRHLSIVDFPLLSKFTPAMLKNVIKIVETMWIEAIKVMKGNILMKMPFILIANIVSNMVYAIMTGNINPIELMKDYQESFRDIRKYIKSDREVAKIKARIKTQKDSKASKVDVARLKELELNMKGNPIHELMEAGLYSAIVEDVEVADLTGTNRWKKAIDDKLNAARVPQTIKTGLQWLYLSEETKWYKINQEVLQMSDLIARDVENRRRKKVEFQEAHNKKKLPSWWVDKHGDDKLDAKSREMFLKEAKEYRHYRLLENYVNYNKPASKVEEYLNRVGAVMFTKYTKNIQRIIATSAYKHPVKSLLTLLGQEYLLDVETIQDQSMLTRSWYNFGFGPGDVLPFHSPLDQLMELLTPALIKPTTWQVIP